MFRTAAMAAVISAAAAWPAGYAWRVEAPRERVQFGKAGADDRVLWIACEGASRLTAGGPAMATAADGSAATVKFGARSYQGRYVRRGDDMEFEVPVGVQDAFLTSLLHNRGFRLEEGGRSVSVPGKGAAKIVAPLLKACG